jgi:hypothetical protein
MIKHPTWKRKHLNSNIEELLINLPNMKEKTRE